MFVSVNSPKKPLQAWDPVMGFSEPAESATVWSASEVLATCGALASVPFWILFSDPPGVMSRCALIRYGPKSASK